MDEYHLLANTYLGDLTLRSKLRQSSSDGSMSRSSQLCKSSSSNILSSCYHSHASQISLFENKTTPQNSMGLPSTSHSWIIIERSFLNRMFVSEKMNNLIVPCHSSMLHMESCKALQLNYSNQAIRGKTQLCYTCHHNFWSGWPKFISFFEFQSMTTMV